MDHCSEDGFRLAFIPFILSIPVKNAFAFFVAPTLSQSGKCIRTLVTITPFLSMSMVLMRMAI